MKIFIGSDHKGFELKEFLKINLERDNFEIEDCGNFVYDYNDDYADFAFKVSENVVKFQNSYGILICGSGAGVCFAANKVKGVRASLVCDEKMAEMARADDDLNVLCLAADFINKEKAWRIVQVFLETKFKNEEKYLRRIKKVSDYENRH